MMLKVGCSSFLSAYPAFSEKGLQNPKSHNREILNSDKGRWKAGAVQRTAGGLGVLNLVVCQLCRLWKRANLCKMHSSCSSSCRLLVNIGSLALRQFQSERLRILRHALHLWNFTRGS